MASEPRELDSDFASSTRKGNKRGSASVLKGVDVMRSDTMLSGAFLISGLAELSSNV